MSMKSLLSKLPAAGVALKPSLDTAASHVANGAQTLAGKLGGPRAKAAAGHLFAGLAPRQNAPAQAGMPPRQSAPQGMPSRHGAPAMSRPPMGQQPPDGFAAPPRALFWPARNTPHSQMGPPPSFQPRPALHPDPLKQTFRPPPLHGSPMQPAAQANAGFAKLQGHDVNKTIPTPPGYDKVGRPMHGANAASQPSPAFNNMQTMGRPGPRATSFQRPRNALTDTMRPAAPQQRPTGQPTGQPTAFAAAPDLLTQRVVRGQNGLPDSDAKIALDQALANRPDHGSQPKPPAQPSASQQAGAAALAAAREKLMASGVIPALDKPKPEIGNDGGNNKPPTKDAASMAISQAQMTGDFEAAKKIAHNIRANTLPTISE